jgi:hypothetical protein
MIRAYFLVAYFAHTPIGKIASRVVIDSTAELRTRQHRVVILHGTPAAAECRVYQ